VDPSVVLQTIREVGGGNFIHRFGRVTQPFDPVSTMNIETLQMDVVRVRMDLDEWEPVNDDDDPAQFRWDAFQHSAYNRATFGFMQEMSARGVTLIASSWAVPDWLVENPEAVRQQEIKVGLVSEAIEMIAAWLLTARDEYGIEVAYVSFNEADYGVNVRLSPKEYGALVAAAGPRFAELGLKTRWLLADAANLGGCQLYARKIWEQSEARPYLGPLACHSWDGLSVPVQILEQLGVYAEELDRELWITEGGWDFQLWQRRQAFPTWNNALRLATNYSRVLKSSRATTFLYWQMSGNDYNTNDGQHAYPSLEMLAQYASAFPPGSQVVSTSPDLITLYSVAGQSPERFALLLVSTDRRLLPVQIEGLPAGTYQHIVSDETEVLQEAGAVEGGMLVEVMLPPKSVNVLTTVR
jgi:O-glycosyl hydrolase